MKSFNRIFFFSIVFIIIIFVFSNTVFLSMKITGGRPYRVEINRIVNEISQTGLNNVDLSKYNYIKNIEHYADQKQFFDGAETDYAIRQINGTIYRFDYKAPSENVKPHLLIYINIILGIMAVVMMIGMLFVRIKILKPFDTLRNVPYELSRGNLTVPLKENKNRFFGKFVWGVDLLRENMEQQKQHELELQREKKMLILSISHDIKTPLSAIKLYSKALSKGLYTDRKKQLEIAESINTKADEIENFISQIIRASKSDFLNLEVNQSEFYLSELMSKISCYYKEKFSLIQMEFFVDSYSDCILYGDINRSIEVLQNIIENAVKYGNGHPIEIFFTEEEDCQLITLKNDGCTLPESELSHIFESFWRGSNSGSSKGSGLGLYICRQLIHKMNGEIFAEISHGHMLITTVFRKV